MKMLAIVTDKSGKVLGKTYTKNIPDAVQWAMDTNQTDTFSLFLFNGHENKPIRHYEFSSLWSCVERSA